jgi:hypothetical protein
MARLHCGKSSVHRPHPWTARQVVRLRSVRVTYQCPGTAKFGAARHRRFG